MTMPDGSFGTPYSVEEARLVAQKQLRDSYHRNIVLWLCNEVNRLEDGFCPESVINFIGQMADEFEGVRDSEIKANDYERASVLNDRAKGMRLVVKALQETKLCKETGDGSGKAQERLRNHIRLCRRNLRSNRIVCCASCPFEDEITAYCPELKREFIRKRANVRAKRIKA